MMSLLAIVSLKADYLYKANQTYDNLVSYEDLFFLEASILNYTKCALMQLEELDDFNINGINVDVYEDGDDYILCFDNKKMKIVVFDRQIINFTYLQ